MKLQNKKNYEIGEEKKLLKKKLYKKFVYKKYNTYMYNKNLNKIQTKFFYF